VASPATGPRIDPQMTLTSTSVHALATAAGAGLIMLICDGVDLGAHVELPQAINDNNSSHDPPPSTPPAAANDNQPPSHTEARINVLNLSDKDVLDLEKTTSTEVVASLHNNALDAQIHGVVDTILNRRASEKWGLSISAVVNARWQFSAINSSLPGAYGSVEKMPSKDINKKVAKEVVQWLRLRAAGIPSSVGDNLNYLNPYYSSEKSLESWGWDVVSQAKMNGMVFGTGRAVHFHGTAKGLKKLRPFTFSVQVPEDMTDGFACTACSKSGSIAAMVIRKNPVKRFDAGQQNPPGATGHRSFERWAAVPNLLRFIFR
jgi:hypothetical protein